MTFKLEINCDNAAFEGEELYDQVAQCLLDAANAVQDYAKEGNLTDLNGNHVGQYAFKGKQPK